jgi:ribosomal protein L27
MNPDASGRDPGLVTLKRPRHEFVMTIRLTLRRVVAAIIFAAQSGCATEGGNTVEDLPTEMVSWRPSDCPTSGLAGRYRNQGTGKLDGIRAIDTRFVWIFNRYFDLWPQREAAVPEFAIDQNIPGEIHISIFGTEREPLKKVTLKADRANFACVDGAVFFHHKARIRSEGGGVYDERITLSKNDEGNLEMFYERKFESRPFFIPFRETTKFELTFEQIK